jgi:hypothetical protein
MLSYNYNIWIGTTILGRFITISSPGTKVSQGPRPFANFSEANHQERGSSAPPKLKALFSTVSLNLIVKASEKDESLQKSDNIEDEPEGQGKTIQIPVSPVKQVSESSESPSFAKGYTMERYGIEINDERKPRMGTLCKKPKTRAHRLSTISSAGEARSNSPKRLKK